MQSERTFSGKDVAIVAAILLLLGLLVWLYLRPGNSLRRYVFGDFARDAQTNSRPTTHPAGNVVASNRASGLNFSTGRGYGATNRGVAGMGTSGGALPDTLSNASGGSSLPFDRGSLNASGTDEGTGTGRSSPGLESEVNPPAAANNSTAPPISTPDPGSPVTPGEMRASPALPGGPRRADSSHIGNALPAPSEPQNPGSAPPNSQNAPVAAPPVVRTAPGYPVRSAVILPPDPELARPVADSGVEALLRLAEKERVGWAVSNSAPTNAVAPAGAGITNPAARSP